MSTETTTEAPSLRDELDRQFDAEAGAPAPSPTPAPAVTTPSPAPAPTAEAPAPGPAAAPPAGQKPGDDPAQDAKDLKALDAAAAANRPIPERLKAKWGDRWDKLDPEVRDQFHAYESDVGRVTSKYGKAAKNWEETQRVLAPYMSMIEAEKGTVHGAIGNLFETARILRQGTPDQKLHLVRQMGQHFGIPLERLGAGSEAAPGAPAPAPAIDYDRLAQLERMVLTQSADVVHNTRTQINSELDEFIADPQNVYVQEPGYLDTMAQLISSGRAQDLKSAYEQAAWLHERTRVLEVAKMNERKAREAASAAAQAQRATVSPGGGTLGNVRRDTSKMSTRELLEAAYNGELET
jgi:hypothetical protein